MSITITKFEKKTYDYIKEQGEVQVSNVPKMMWGAIPNLKKAGLVETYKKHTFVKILKGNNLKNVT